MYTYICIKKYVYICIYVCIYYTILIIYTFAASKNQENLEFRLRNLQAMTEKLGENSEKSIEDGDSKPKVHITDYSYICSI